MPDVYAAIAEADPGMIEQVAEAMEVSATDPQQQAMVTAYLADVAVPSGARVLEIGCGTGAICRLLGRPTSGRAAHSFFGHVAYASMTARKPG